VVLVVHWSRNSELSSLRTCKQAVEVAETEWKVLAEILSHTSHVILIHTVYNTMRHRKCRHMGNTDPQGTQTQEGSGSLSGKMGT